MNSQIELREELIDQRNDEMAELNQDMMSLHEMFRELALHISAQGDSLNTISDNIEECSRDVESATNTLQSIPSQSHTKLLIISGIVLLTIGFGIGVVIIIL
tara:strand:+ start:1406 stop:1711 length:306 start_codon:yes stop_codon:yes gene_type:complete